MVPRSVHSIVEVPISEIGNGVSIPILILENGEVSLLSLAWARDLRITESISPPAIFLSIQAVGLLYDFYILVLHGRPLSEENVGWLLSRFLEARQHGNKLLNWLPVSRKTARNDLTRVSAFSSFCATNFGHLPLNPKEKKLIEDMSFQDQLAHTTKLANRNKWDKLSHLIPATSEAQGVVQSPKLRPRTRSPSRNNNYDYFPPDKVWTLINSTRSARDKMYYLLLFFGATRESEPLHLFVTDVKVLPNGAAKVILADPVEATYKWIDTYKGKCKGFRTTFLHERYGLSPRNTLGVTHPLRSGWKGMEYRSDKQTEVEWLIPGIDKLFGKLHIHYMKTVRRYVEDAHPYYFVNEKEDADFGKPLKLSNITKSFYRAAKRVGLLPSDQGVNPHGARHFFGHFCASYLRLPIETTKILMRHVNIQSTEVYYSLNIKVARDELEKAQSRINDELKQFYLEADKAIDKESRHDD